jgi:hypothetical protein
MDAAGPPSVCVSEKAIRISGSRGEMVTPCGADLCG